MNPSITNAAVHDFVVRHLAEVFTTMLSLPAVPVAELEPGSPHERVSGSGGFVGEQGRARSICTCLRRLPPGSPAPCWDCRRKKRRTPMASFIAS